MLKHLRLTPEFVQYIPQQLTPGILYISTEFGTVTHSCCCGCGTEIVTPLHPTSWKITFDGETVSLSPSVGNWNIPCRSHYIIDKNRVLECEPWTTQQVKQEQIRAKKAQEHFFNQPKEVITPPTVQPTPQKTKINRIMNYLSNFLK